MTNGYIAVVLYVCFYSVVLKPLDSFVTITRVICLRCTSPNLAHIRRCRGESTQYTLCLSPHFGLKVLNVQREKDQTWESLA